MSAIRPDGVRHTFSLNQTAKPGLSKGSSGTNKIVTGTDVITGAYTSHTGQKEKEFQDQTSMENYLRGGKLNLHLDPLSPTRSS